MTCRQKRKSSDYCLFYRFVCLADGPHRPLEQQRRRRAAADKQLRAKQRLVEMEAEVSLGCV